VGALSETDAALEIQSVWGYAHLRSQSGHIEPQAQTRWDPQTGSSQTHEGRYSVTVN